MPDASTSMNAARPIISWRWPQGLFWALLALGLGGPFAVGQETHRLEYQVKAAFLYNFAKFVDWPPSAFPAPGTPITITILGKDPFGSVLDEMVQDKLIEGRRIIIKRTNDPGKLAGCHLLFVSVAEKERLPQVLRALRDASVLTVTEMDPFSTTEGVINFATVQGKVRFEVHPEAAERVHLKLSSKILRLALKPSDTR